MEPHVDAFGVEVVVALGEAATHLILFELRQAHGAFHGRVGIRIRVGLGGVDKNRERIEDSRVEATRGGGGCGCGVHVKDKLIAAVSVAAHVTTAGAEEVPTGVEMEANHEYDNEKQDDYGAKHNLATEGVILVV